MLNDELIPTKQDVKNWIDELPLINIMKSAQSIHNYISELLKHSLSAHDLFDYLELFEPTSDYLRKELQANYLGETTLTKQQLEHVVELSLNLELQFATSYVTILQSLVKAQRENEDPVFHATIIIRTITLLTNLLLIHYLTYQTIPEKMWSKLHKLYLHAEKYHIEELMTNTEENQPIHRSIADAYKHALLLATADLSHLRPKDMSKLNQSLFSWSSLAKVENEDYSNAIFVIYLDKDSPPLYQEISTGLSQRFYIRGFNTKILTDYLKELLEQNPDQGSNKIITGSLRRETINYLINVWDNPFNRKHQRIKQQGKFDLCFGLSATHHFLEAARHINKLPQKAKQPNEDFFISSSANPLNLQQDQGNKIESLVSRRESSTKEDYYDPWQKLAEKATDVSSTQHGPLELTSEKYKIYRWDIVDSSPGGYCLISAKEKPPRLTSGEIIGLGSPEFKANSQWMIGVVRWLQAQGNETKIGVKLLSPSTMAVNIQIQRISPSEVFSSILLPELINQGQTSSLILPPFDYRPGEHAYITSNHLELEVKFTKMLTSNECFYQTEYELISTIRDNNDAEPIVKVPTIDSVWDEL